MKKLNGLGRKLLLSMILKKQKEKEEKEKRITQKIAYASSSFLLVVNVLLLADVFLPRIQVEDSIDHVTMISLKRSSWHRLTTTKGYRFNIEPKGTETKGHRIKMKVSPMFKMPIEIRDEISGDTIDRQFNAGLLVKILSPLLVLMAAYLLFWKKSAEALQLFLPIIAATQLILLIL